MNIVPTAFDFFRYADGQLYCEDVSVDEIAKKQGSPVYVYSHAALEKQYGALEKAFAGVKHQICFAVKANSNAAILKTFFNQGGGADVVSGGELRRALLAGCPANRIVFSGVGKTSEEIHLALQDQILQFNVESEQELMNIQRVAAFLDRRAPVSVRVNPDVDAKTHPYISTGLSCNKFGVFHDEAVALYQKAAKMSHVDIVGIDCHIGSQLVDVQPFEDAMLKIRELVLELKALGISLKNIDVGGGLGIRYKDEATPSPQDYAAAILKHLRDLGCCIVLEPGRFLVGNAGILVSKVIYTKKGGDGRNFTIVDAAFNDLMRPMLYDAYHEILPVSIKADRACIKTDIVGPICETTDSLATARDLQLSGPGELLAIMSAGAYGMSMSSTYNSRGRVAEVMVRDKEFFVIKKPDRLEDIIAKEAVPEFLKDKG